MKAEEAALVDPLTSLAVKHGTDKWGLHFYTPLYHRLFASFRERPVRLLEIGVGGYGYRSLGGASLAMWAEYFPLGRIVGIDVFAKTLDMDPRVIVLHGSQSDTAFLREVAATHGPFDIVIDDGSHRPQHVVSSFIELFPHVADGGIYVVEDVQTAFVSKYGGDPATGGETYRLADALLKAINHAEIAIASPHVRSNDMARSIRAFHAWHNLFAVEKGDNTEPSNLTTADLSDPHMRRAMDVIAAERDRRPTAAAAALAAEVYVGGGEFGRALSTVLDALEMWPEDLRLLVAAAEIGRRMGDEGIATEYFARAAAVDPTDPRLQKRLQR